MKAIWPVLVFVFMLWTLFSTFRKARAREKEESAARPHSEDVPAVGWVIVAAATVGFPAFMVLHDTGHKPTDMPTWLVVMFSAVMGFIISAGLVVGGTFLARAIKGTVSVDSPDSPPPKPVSVWSRVFTFVGSGLILAYGIHGLWVDDLYIPGSTREGRTIPGTHLHGVAADLVFAGYVVLTLGVLASQSHSASRGVSFLKYWRVAAWVGMGLILIGVFWK